LPFLILRSRASQGSLQGLYRRALVLAHLREACLQLLRLDGHAGAPLSREMKRLMTSPESPISLPEVRNALPSPEASNEDSRLRVQLR
jgi:hypothetical protein